MATIEDAAGKCGLFTDGDWILSENMATEGTIGVIQLKHVGVGEFHDKEFQFISNSTFNELGCTEVQPGDVLISRMADPIGRACIVPRLPFRVVTAVDVSILRVDESVADSRFITHLCNSTLVRNRIARAARGTTRSRITRTELGETEIPLPSLPEQQRIAGQLGQADQLVRTRRYALELTDTFLPAAFLEFFGDYLTPACSSVLNDVLALPLSNGFFEKNSVYGAGVPVIWVDNLYHTMTIDLENLRRARATAEQITSYRVMEGDLLFTRSSLVREGIGQINIVPRLPEPALFECHVIRARVNANRINPFYVLGLYRSSFGKAHILKRANTATMTTISQGALEELPCPIPPLPLQQQFAALVERVERLRAVQREALRQAEHLFASLLHRAFCG
jgi:type I restriction enzyme S subunit